MKCSDVIHHLRKLRRLRLLAATTLAALTAAYCLPGHPHLSSGSVADALAHVVAFFLLFFVLERSTRRRARALAAMALLAIGLEVLQQLLGGYRAVEWSDMAANLAGVLLAALVLRRVRSPAADAGRTG